MNARSEVRVILEGGTELIVEADCIGGAGGELILFNHEDVVLLVAAGDWKLAVKLPRKELLS